MVSLDKIEGNAVITGFDRAEGLKVEDKAFGRQLAEQCLGNINAHLGKTRGRKNTVRGPRRKIFTGLNVTQGLPIPIVIRFDYHGHVPGARDRAEANCKRVADALRARYSELAQDGLLHTLLAIRDCAAGETIEVLESSVFSKSIAGAH